MGIMTQQMVESVFSGMGLSVLGRKASVKPSINVLALDRLLGRVTVLAVPR